MRPPVPEPRNPSYWKLSAGAARHPRLERELTTDVAVIGGGITGLTTALFMKRAGLRVAVLEAGRIGEGVTGYSTAKLTSLHQLTYAAIEDAEGEVGARTYARANEWAIGAVTGVVGELGLDCGFERRPALTYAVEEEGVTAIDREVAAAGRAGLPVEHVENADLPFPIAAGVLLRNQACFDPLRYCRGLARAVEGDGCEIYEETRIVDVDEDADPMRLRTADGLQVRASWGVLACGLPFLDRGGFFARTHPSRSYCVALESEGPLPESMSIDIEQPTHSVRPITAPDGSRLLLVAGYDHKVGQAGDTPARYAHLEEFARRHFDVGRVAARWSAQDNMPVDRVPLIGRMPLSSDRLLVATGFKKWGLTTGTLAARILTDLVEGDDNPWAPLFDARRSQLPSGAAEAVKENANVMKRFVGDRIRQRAGDDPEALRPGTGGICRVEGEAVAAFRDESGELHLLSPVCTHMGCRVTWNEAEQSWDCPCHGSRFSSGGEVLTGPALSRLEPR